MAYKLIVEKRVEKYLRRLEPKRYFQITKNYIQKLTDFPLVMLDFVPLRGAKLPNSYRLRVGDWRILFTVYPEVGIIRIWKIDTRGDIY